MDQSDPNIVARLVALNERTRKVWAHPHNKRFYMPASFQGFSVHDGRSREPTPCDEDMKSCDHVEDTEPELRLCFNNRPKDISKGWVFGSDQTACDIYCGEYDKKRMYNIGRQTFSITISEQSDVVLQHLNNTNRTEVQYGSQKAGRRREFVWIMFTFCQSIVITSANQLKFQVIVADPSVQSDSYKRMRAQFLKKFENSMPSMPLLAMSPPTTQPFFYRCEDRILGIGSFGMVSIVVDASTGVKYAGKAFFGAFDPSEADILAKQKHENILRYVTLSNDDGPLLVTEYVEGGNLARPWETKDRPMWQPNQILSILTQCLRGLASLHAKPNPVIHRDIKPENILVADIDRGVGPTESWIKLADFGLATQGTRCRDGAGTWLYTAPEVFFGRPFNSKVDIWSLGVVITQLLLKGNLPMPTQGYMQGPDWCKDVVNLARWNCNFSSAKDRRKLKSNQYSLHTLLWGFVAKSLLRTNPDERLSARECLNDRCFLDMQSGIRTAAEGPLSLGNEEGEFRESDARGEFGPKPEGFWPEQSSRGVVAKQELSGNPIIRSPSTWALLEEFLGNPVVTSPSMTALMQNAKSPPAAYDPGVEVAEVLKDQGSSRSKTAKPLQAVKPENPQPVSFGLVVEECDENATGKVG